MIKQLIIISIVLLTVLNLIASIYVGRAAAYNKKQKIAQIVIVWLLPVIGALIMISFLQLDREDGKRKKGPGNATEITENQAVLYGIADHMNSNK